jgi:Mg-chelatase subunit ChlI
MRAARALAALDGAPRGARSRSCCQVAPPALRHRLRRDPLDETGVRHAGRARPRRTVRRHRRRCGARETCSARRLAQPTVATTRHRALAEAWGRALRAAALLAVEPAALGGVLAEGGCRPGARALAGCAR